jgi:hypothetical protein
MIARACDVPRDGLLQAYVGQGETYTDCFEVMSPVGVTLPEFIEAFYTTWLFRLERLVLQVVLRRWIRDTDVKALATGADAFAAWTVEGRDEAQILLCDFAYHTRSYQAVSSKQGGATRLVFGSAVVVAEGKEMGRITRALLPLHRFYSKALLRLAERKLRYS